MTQASQAQPPVQGQKDEQAPITKAGDWFAARLAGKRLPEHLFPEERK